MEKIFAKYMKWGKLVKHTSTGAVYKLIEDMDGGKETVKVVGEDVLSRYELLRAWERNWEQNSIGFRERFTEENIKESAIERQGYETEVDISDIIPHNMIRFITPDYKTKFEVVDLSTVSVSGKEAMVTFMDETHFTFVDTISTNLYGGCFHICQFAEICEKESIEVLPVA
jgi:hypothetical protein